ncbi:MAG: RNA polymerase sigma factor [Planctomycetota bacterium]
MKRLTRDEEAALVARCALGEPEAWPELVDVYGPLVRALAQRMLLRRSGRAAAPDVDEVVADVFLALVRRDRLLLSRFDPTYRFSTYLGVICRTQVVRLLRRAGRRPVPVEELGQVPGRETDLGPAGALREQERAEALASLRAALEELGERDRLLLTLRFLDGQDYRAIARALAISPESVGQLLTRAKARLRERVPHLERWLAPVEDEG